ncbi:MAG: hypothetical protein V1663_01615 [archaeon]
MKSINRHILKSKTKKLVKRVLIKGRVKGKILAKRAAKRFFVEEKKLRVIIRKELNNFLKERKAKNKKKKR